MGLIRAGKIEQDLDRLAGEDGDRDFFRADLHEALGSARLSVIAVAGPVMRVAR